MENTKKIITRAVFGHINQTFRNTARYAINEEEKYAEILGCTIVGAKVLSCCIEGGDEKSKKVKVNLNFDLHIWYQSKNDTKISKVNAELSDIVEIANQGTEKYSHEDVYVWIRGIPKCVDKPAVTQTEGNLFAVQIEYVLEAEIVGETAINVKVFE